MTELRREKKERFQRAAARLTAFSVLLSSLGSPAARAQTENNSPRIHQEKISRNEGVFTPEAAPEKGLENDVEVRIGEKAGRIQRGAQWMLEQFGTIAEMSPREQDIARIVDLLRLPSDPKIRIVIAKERRRYGTTYDFISPNEVVLTIPSGILALTTDLSEFAGILAFELAKIRLEYQQRLADLLEKHGLEKNENTRPALKAKLDQVTREFEELKKEIPEPERYTDENYKKFENLKKDFAALTEGFTLLDLVEKDRAQQREKLERIMEGSGVEISLSGENRRSVEAVKDAIDRMVRGGFNPWSVIDPLERVSTLNRAITGPISLFTRYFKGPTLQTEIAFAGWYVTYLEQKKVSVVHQRFRDKALPETLESMRRQVMWTQILTNGPVMRNFGGTAAAIGGGAVLIASLKAGKEVAREEGAKEATTHIDTAVSTASNVLQYLWSKLPDRKDLPDMPNLGIFDFLGNILDGIWWLLSKLNMSFFEVLRKLNITIPDWIKNLDYGPLVELMNTSLRFLGDNWGHVFMFSLAGMFAEKTLVRILSYLQQRYFLRFKNHARLQAAVAARLAAWHSLPGADTNALIRLADLQRNASVFLEDGMAPNIDRVRLRLFYQYMHKGAIGDAVRIKKTDPGVAEVFEGYKKAAKAELETELEEAKKRGKKVDPLRALSEKNVHARAQAIFFQDYYTGDTEIFKNSVPEVIVDRLDSNAKVAQKYQRFLFRHTGGATVVLGSLTTQAIIAAIDKKLADPKTSAEDRAKLGESLRKLGGIELYSLEARRAYLDTLAKHGLMEAIDYREITLPELEKRLADKKISESEFRLALSLVADRVSADPTKAIATFVALAKQQMWTDALRSLNRNLAEVVTAIETGKLSPADLKLFVSGMQRLMENWSKLPNALLTRTVLQDMLFYKLLSIKNPLARAAIFGHLNEVRRVRASPLSPRTSLFAIYEWMVRSSLEADPVRGVSKIEKLDYIGSTFAEQRFTSRLLAEEIQSNRQLLAGMEDVDRVLRGDHFWDKLGDITFEGLSSYEKSILERYRRLGKKYQSFTYNPRHSEIIQTKLLEAFRRLNPDATPVDHIEFWQRLAARGSTGVTDAYFKDIRKMNLDPAEEKRLVEVALEKGYIGSDTLRAEVYKKAHQDNVSVASVRRYASEKLEALVTALNHAAMAGGSGETEVKEAMRVYREGFVGTEADDMRMQRFFRSVMNDKRRGMGPDQTQVQLDLLWSQLQPALVEAARKRFIDTEFRRVGENFADSADVATLLGNWLLNRVRASEGETEYLRKVATANKSGKGGDLAVNTVKEIVDIVHSWPKEQRWEFVRWLRNTGPPPEKLIRMFRHVGLETVRGLYNNLPIGARAVMVEDLIGAAKTGVLRGMEKDLFYEQVLSEILPRDKQAAGIAKDFLEAFLHSTELVSHATKRNQVIAFLLANQNENANVGEVLRNVLEQFGVPGVKLGQLLAANDMMPPEIRRELAKLRDSANEPTRMEVYEHLRSVFKIPNVEKHFLVLDILGSASVKYAISVLDLRDGQIHVLQLKRPEAEKATSRDFLQLEIIVSDLIKRNPKRYAFLAGIVAAVKAAIAREVVFAEETKNTWTSKRQYERAEYPEGVRLNFPNPTDLVESMPGAFQKQFLVRSSAFVPGDSIEKLSPEGQEKMAKTVLELMHDMFYPEQASVEYRNAYFTEEGERVHIEPDRHPGNERMAEGKLDRVLGHGPIDFGQLFTLDIKERDRIIRLMAFSEFFALFGPVPEVLDQFFKEFPFEKKARGTLEKAIRANFPVNAAKSQGSVASYYYLLAKMEEAGFQRRVANYDFVKAHFQLEAYEEFLVGVEHRSPKRTLEAAIKRNMENLALGLTVDRRRLLKEYALSMAPWRALAAVKIAERNRDAIQSGKLDLRHTLAAIGLPEPRIALVLDAAPQDFATGADVLRWLDAYFGNPANKIPPAEMALVARWKAAPMLAELHPDLLSAEEFLRAMRSPGVMNHMNRNTEVRAEVPQPKIVGAARTIGEIYGAELVNAVFWAIWEQDPEKAKQFVQHLLTIEKHVGFAAFAASSGLYTSLTSRKIPMSHEALRYLNMHGASMAVGMVAQDIATRVLRGESFAAIVDHTLSKENASEVTYATLAFMAAGATVDAALHQAKRVEWLHETGCKLPLKALWRYAAVFIGAEAIMRNARDPLMEMGVLPVGMEQHLEALRKKHQPLLKKVWGELGETAKTLPWEARIEALFGTKENLSYHPLLSIRSFEKSGELVQQIKEHAQAGNCDTAKIPVTFGRPSPEDHVESSLAGASRQIFAPTPEIAGSPNSFVGALQSYVRDLRELETTIGHRDASFFVKKEIETFDLLLSNTAKEIFPTFPTNMAELYRQDSKNIYVDVLRHVCGKKFVHRPSAPPARGQR